MNQKYKVWCDDYDDEESGGTVETWAPEYAAEKWVEDNHADLDYADEIDVKVKDEKGVVTVWTVTVEQRPTFHATEKKKGESNAAG